MISIDQRRNYAEAVITGRLSRAEAYRRYINTDAANPSKAAYSFEKTKPMKDVIDRVIRTLELEDKLYETTLKARVGYMEAVSWLAGIAKDSSAKEANPLLKTIGGSIEEELTRQEEDRKNNRTISTVTPEPPRLHQNYDPTGIIISPR